MDYASQAELDLIFTTLAALLDGQITPDLERAVRDRADRRDARQVDSVLAAIAEGRRRRGSGQPPRDANLPDPGDAARVAVATRQAARELGAYVDDRGAVSWPVKSSDPNGVARAAQARRNALAALAREKVA